MSDPGTADDQSIPLLESAEGDEERGGLEGNAQALLYLLKVYTLTQRNADVDFMAFAGFVRGNSQRFVLKFPQLVQFGQHTEGMVATYLKVLADHGLCSLERSGDEIRIIRFPQFYTELVNKAYADLANHPDWPLPNEEQMGIELPPELVTDVNVKTDFVAALGELRPERTTILRLVFPELIHPVVITSDLVQKKLLELAVLKVRQFVAMRNNAGYVTHRLNTVLRGHEHGLRDLINTVMAKPGRAVGTLLEPSDFTFRFWAHFANLILQEYRERADKVAEEHSYCQAAYLIGLYNVHYRGRQQRASEKDTLVKRFEAQFRKYPYAYTLKDLYALRDDRGIPLIRKNTKDVFTEFLEAKTKRDDLKGLPEVVHIRTIAGKDYYVRREMVVPLFVKLVHEKSQELRDGYVEEWERLLKENRRIPAMSEDSAFERDLDLSVRNRYPFLYSLLNQNLLILAKDVAKIDYDMARTMQRVLDPKRGTLSPLTQILEIQRKDLLERAKLRVPLFRRMSLFRNLFYWFQRIFQGLRRSIRESAGEVAGDGQSIAGQAGRAGVRDSGGEGKARGGTGGPASPGALSRELRDAPAGSTTLRPSSASQSAAYQKAVARLKLELVGREKSIPESLNELEERWNPLYDSQARTELVEDVNAMIRDYFRTLKRSFRVSPPTVARIKDLAAKLSENKAFERIKRRDIFVHYIQVYMLKLMGER